MIVYLSWALLKIESGEGRTSPNFNSPKR